jgi:hypothetical protein
MTGQRIRRVVSTASPLISQVVSSLGNFALVLLCSRFLDKTSFGRFSLAYALILFLSQLLRVGIAESAMISKDRSRTADGQVARRIMSGGVAASVGFGFVCGLISLVGGIAFPFAAAIAFAAFAVPLTDITRYVYFLVSPRTSVKIDLGWAITGIVAVLALRATGALSETSMLAAWGASALLASVVPVIRQVPTRAIHSLRCGFSEPGAWRLVLDTALLTGSSLTLLAVLAARASSAEVGEFRAAAIPFTWIQIAHAGGYLSVARQRESTTLVNSRTTSIVICAGLFACALTTLGLRVLPAEIGMAVFGKGWSAAVDLAVVIGFQYASFVVAETLMGAMKIVLGAEQVVRIRIAFSLAFIPLVAILSTSPTARAAVICLSTANVVIIAAAGTVLKLRTRIEAES